MDFEEVIASGEVNNCDDSDDDDTDAEMEDTGTRTAMKSEH